MAILRKFSTYVLPIVLICFLPSCDPPVPPGTMEIELTQTVNDILPGWRRHYTDQLPDTLPPNQVMVRFPGEGMIRSEIHASDIVLDRGDSVRIAIIRPLELIFAIPEPTYLPDQLLIGPYGQDTLPIVLDQSNVGIISSSTVFRVNRQFYSLNSVDSSRQRIQIGKLPRKPNRPPAAEFNSRFKNIPIKMLAGQDSLIRRTPGRSMLIYFWSLGTHGGEDLLKLDSLVQNIPADRRPEVISISRSDSQSNLLNFAERHTIRTPIYQGVAESCSGLHCHALVPNAVLVNGAGRIVSYHLRGPGIRAYLTSLLPERE